MTQTTNPQLVNLHKTAQHLKDEWESREAIDWQQAEDLVEQINKMDYGTVCQHPILKGIAQHAAENDEWDSGLVGNWPDAIIIDFEGAEKVYSYQPNGDNWNVIATNPATGEWEWRATVETERLAEIVVEALKGNIELSSS